MPDCQSKRPFWALFVVQLLGALGGNLFKNCLMFIIAYRALTWAGFSSATLVIACSGLYILPYFLFSAWAGQLADKLAKNELVKGLKIFELACIGLASLSLYWLNLPLLMTSLFLLGVQAAFFGPVKYSILPELVSQEWLLPANAHIESGTFIAIILGTIAGGLLSASGDHFAIYTIGLLATNSLIGLAFSFLIPKLKPAQKDLALSINPWPAIKESYQAAKFSPPIFNSILFISWFWFIGSACMAIMPTMGSDLLNVSAEVITFYLTLFCLGIGAGTLLCNQLCKKNTNLGLIPLGSFLMAFSLVALSITLAMWGTNVLPLKASLFFQTATSWLLGGEFFLIALAGGLLTVPLYTILQTEAPQNLRSRVIAANNIFNAIFMVAAAILLMLFESLELKLWQQIIFLAIFQLLMALNAGKIWFRDMNLLICRILAHLGYRIDIYGRENLPAKGPALLIANHNTFIDWLFIAAIAPTPPAFVMYKDYYFKNKILQKLLAAAQAIPIASSHEDAELLQKAFSSISLQLQGGEMIGFFPEGKLTRDGQMNEFKTGIERIIAKDPCPVYPMAIHGLWGSIFSRHPKPYRPHLGRRHLTMIIGEAVYPEELSATLLHQKVAELLQNAQRHHSTGKN